MLASCAAPVSKSTTREAGISASEATRRPHSILPPLFSIIVIKASAIRCDPPAIAGQPDVCADNPMKTPTPAVPARSNDSIECAANPAKSARAGSPEKRDIATDCAERRPNETPNLAASNGCFGSGNSGLRITP